MWPTGSVCYWVSVRFAQISLSSLCPCRYMCTGILDGYFVRKTLTRACILEFHAQGQTCKYVQNCAACRCKQISKQVSSSLFSTHVRASVDVSALPSGSAPDHDICLTFLIPPSLSSTAKCRTPLPPVV